MRLINVNCKISFIETSYYGAFYVICKFDYVHDSQRLIGSSVVRHVAATWRAAQRGTVYGVN